MYQTLRPHCFQLVKNGATIFIREFVSYSVALLIPCYNWVLCKVIELLERASSFYQLVSYSFSNLEC